MRFAPILKHCQRHCFIVTVVLVFSTYLFLFDHTSTSNYSLAGHDDHYQLVPYSNKDFPYHTERIRFLINSTFEAAHFTNEWRHLTRLEEQKLSALGRNLFLEDSNMVDHPDDNFQILVWKYGNTIESRHMKSFTNDFTNPFLYCPVSNCNITYHTNAIQTSDLVLFHLHRITKSDITTIKKLYQRSDRPSHQIWAFMSDESPFNTFLNRGVALKSFNGLFHWSVNYRMEADVPVPYGRTVRLAKPLQGGIMVDIGYKQRQVLVAIMSSNCGGRNHRWDYVRQLQKYIRVDVYGQCGPFKGRCTGHFRVDCPIIDTYLFYLAFENSNCKEYVTEKVWWNAYHKNAIPIVMGASLDYQKLLPPHSYLHVNDYASPQSLAHHILYLNQTNEYQQYFGWKRSFTVLNEHGYFGSRSWHYCRLCQALNYRRNTTKSLPAYKNLEKQWNQHTDCYPTWNAI